MTITIGTSNSDRRKLSKQFTPKKTISCNVKEPCSVINPVFIVKADSVPYDTNYLRGAFGRDYFVNDVVYLTGNRAELHCTVDVLGSYASQIQGIRCNVTRQQTRQNAMVSDSGMVVKSSTEVSTMEFSNNPFSDSDVGKNYVLTVMGG